MKSETRNEPVKPNSIKVMPSKGLIVIDTIKTLTNYEKDAKKKDPKILLSKEQITSYNKSIIESTGDATKVWSEHPDQGIIVAIHKEDAEAYELRVGDHIAYNHSEHTGILVMYNKKRYVALRPSEIIMRYLTDEV
jgi:prephenate dehydratase